MSDRLGLSRLILLIGIMEGDRALKDYQQVANTNPGFAEGFFNQGSVLVLP